MRSGYVAVIGRANAGKSTLINVMVGEKVSIVSPKPQTTRDRILGVLTEDDYQIVFVDTPGIYKARNELTDRMMRSVETSARSVDYILYVVDGHDGIDEEEFTLMKKYKDLGIPMAIAYTKIDIMPKENIPLDMAKISDAGLDLDVFPVSARKGRNIKALKEFLAAQLPEGEKVFEQEIVSDKSEKFMVAEIMREKILLKFDKEIPHGIAIVINVFRLQENGVWEINLDIVCERASHKAILIGKQGKAIKEVSSFARQDMEKFLGAKVFLTTYVKVKEDWRDRPNLLKQYGYEEKDEF
ncbi:MAG: GTPase Era [Clostridiales bacterium]|nr:GTPase Era [Clostridiales bacterium]MBO5334662.1 GTPase Era [Clostridia bacterium]